jgi:hypothetical protein
MANSSLSDFPRFRSVVMESLEFHTVRNISQNDLQFLLSATIEEQNRFLGDMTGGLVYAMRAIVLGVKGKEEVLASELVPATWVDHLKDAIVDRFPKLGRWVGTIKRRKIDTKIQHYSLCPHTHIPKRDGYNVHEQWMVDNSASPSVADRFQLTIADEETARELERILNIHFIVPSSQSICNQFPYAKNYLVQALDNFRQSRAVPASKPPAKPPGFGDEL